VAARLRGRVDVCGAGAAAAPRAPKGTAAVFQIAHEQGATESFAKLVTDRVAQLCRSSGAFDQVLTSGDIQSLLSLEAQKQMMNCDTTSCMRELGDALNARYVLVGSVGRLGTSALLNMRLLDAKGGTVAASVGEVYRATTDEGLMFMVPRAVAQLLNGAGLGAEATETQEPEGASRRLPLWGAAAAGSALAGAVLGASVLATAAGLTAPVVYRMIPAEVAVNGRPVFVGGFATGVASGALFLAVFLLGTAASAALWVAGFLL
jgi:hypothetical protein